jgi:hypothetical protein
MKMNIPDVDAYMEAQFARFMNEFIYQTGYSIAKDSSLYSIARIFFNDGIGIGADICTSKMQDIIDKEMTR